jgi:membrane-bound acyltransferase YfiQ involved in biofilm formation
MNGVLKSAIYSSMMEYKMGPLNQIDCDSFDVRHSVVSTLAPQGYYWCSSTRHAYVALIKTFEFSATRYFIGWYM